HLDGAHHGGRRSPAARDHGRGVLGRVPRDVRPRPALPLRGAGGRTAVLPARAGREDPPGRARGLRGRPRAGRRPRALRAAARRRARRRPRRAPGGDGVRRDGGHGRLARAALGERRRGRSRALRRLVDRRAAPLGRAHGGPPMSTPMDALPRPKTGRLLNVARFAMSPLRSLEQWERLGEIVHVPMVGADFLLLTDPEQIGEMLLDRERNFVKDGYTRELGRVLGQGLLTSEGEVCRAHRQLAAHAFTPKRIKSYTEKMVARGAALERRLREGERIDLHRAMFEVTLEIVGDTLFDADVSGDAADVGHALEVITEFFATSVEA